MNTRESSKLNALLYFIVKMLIVAVGMVIYLNCFCWTPVFGSIMLILFGILFYNTAEKIINFIIYLNTKPMILKEEDLGDEENNTNNTAILHYTLFDKESDIIEAFDICKKNIEENPTLKYIYIDDTKNEEILLDVKQKISVMQEEFGADKIFYFHRSLESIFLGRLGMISDISLLLYEGITRPKYYIDEKYSLFRDKERPIFDIVLGDIGSLGIEGEIDDILKGTDVSINKENRLENVFMSGIKTIWNNTSIQKIINKIKHSSNKDFTCLQPFVENLDKNLNEYLKIKAWSKDMLKFNIAAKSRLFGVVNFCGIGVLNVKNFIKNIIKTEACHPLKGFQDNLKECFSGKALLLEDVCVYEKVSVNKFKTLFLKMKRQAHDLVLLKLLFTRKIPCCKKNLSLLKNNKELLLSIWVSFTLICFISRCGINLKSDFLFIGYLFIIAILNLLVLNVLGLIEKQRQEVKEGISYGKENFSLPTILGMGFMVLIHTVIVDLLDIAYVLLFLVKNIFKVFLNKNILCFLDNIGEIKINKNLVDMYKEVKLPFITGIVLILLVFMGVIPKVGFIFISPFIISFIFGPAMIRQISDQ